MFIWEPSIGQQKNRDEVLTDLSLTVAEAQRHLTDIFDTDGVKQKIDAKIEACDYTIETDTKLKAATLY